MHTPPRQPQRTAPHVSGTPQTHLASLYLAALMCASGMASASTPQEKMECTQAPRSQWMSEAQARKLFKAETYALVKFKISKGNCHEFYAVDHQGNVVEAYIHPVTGAQVRITRIPAPVQTHSNPQGVQP
ncbi:MAG: PepSY domain-containing protein [Burkholderiales bacterium]|nr:PepSY domain-containing protein [Burkholderiales bacterium]